MKLLRATSAKDLALILDSVHDRTYDISRIDFDQAGGVLRIPIALGSHECEGTLLVKSASSFEVKDGARIGEGDINTIRYSGNRIEIKGALPVDITVTAEKLDIELFLPDDAPEA
jgi:hypothetical protein